MKSWASESKPFESRSKGEFPGRARRKKWLSRSKLKQGFLTDSDAELFMYLIQCILGSAHEKFGVWNGPNRNVTITGSSLKRTSVFVGDYFARDWHKKGYQ